MANRRNTGIAYDQHLASAHACLNACIDSALGDHCYIISSSSSSSGQLVCTLSVRCCVSSLPVKPADIYKMATSRKSPVWNDSWCKDLLSSGPRLLGSAHTTPTCAPQQEGHLSVVTIWACASTEHARTHAHTHLLHHVLPAPVRVYKGKGQPHVPATSGSITRQHRHTQQMSTD